MLLILPGKRIHLQIFGLCIIILTVCAFCFAVHPLLTEWQGKGWVISYVNTSHKVIALTFDDGPDPEATPMLLDILDKNKANATFFVLGVQGEKHPALVKKIVNNGHELASHGYSHKFKNYGNKDFFIDDIQKNNVLLFSLTGVKPLLFRPPGGYLSSDLVDYANKNGIKIITWTWQADYKDWKARNSDKLAQSIIKNASPGQIVLLHDGGQNREVMIRALTKSLPELARQGYRFVTVSELLALKTAEQ
ncbi:MAG: polysaccharide deacetylase family protein [Acidobacteriota bacterium]